MNALEEFLTFDLQGPKVKIGVVGDAMIDEYFNVRVKKISPEFPIPVMHSDTELSEDFPGGAANVVYQFKHFNVDSNLIAFADHAAENCVFKLKGVNTDLCVNIPNKIPRKRRFYSDDFPTYRWDIELPEYGLENIEKYCFQLYEKAQRVAEEFNVLIFSDYNKGVMSKYLDLLIPEVPISIVDPKCGDIDRWRGCTIFKPNLQEALALSGKSLINEAGLYLLDQLKCEAVIITQAGKGVTVFDDGEIFEIRPTCKLPPAESVIGAGDCFTAFLAMAMARGMGIRKSASVAWQAGVLYVKNRHNQPIKHIDLMNVFDPASSKMISSEDLKKRDFRLVFSNGCFDAGLTRGHIECLRFAKQQGDKLIVAINSDASVRRLKGLERPVLPLLDRMKIIASLECVDYVIPFEEDTPLELIKKICPDVIVKGGDYKSENVVGGNLSKVIIFPTVDCISTTEKLRKLENVS